MNPLDHNDTKHLQPFETENIVPSNAPSLGKVHFMLPEYLCAQFCGEVHNVSNNLTVSMKDGCRLFSFVKLKLCQHKSCQNTVL